MVVDTVAECTHLYVDDKVKDTDLIISCNFTFGFHLAQEDDQISASDWAASQHCWTKMDLAL